jgi:hypothetical protein
MAVKGVVVAVIAFAVTVGEEFSSDLTSFGFCSLVELDVFSKNV